MRSTYDLIILGSGAGGATLAYSLRHTGMRILVVERGDFLPKEPQNWDTTAVFGQRRYRTTEVWRNADSGRRIQPTEYYFVGGKTKVFGAAFLRLRQRDFESLEHCEGISPAWPVSYSEMEPYYARAEQLYRVHGTAGADPTEPSRSAPYPYPALPQGEYIQQLTARLCEQGLRPFPIPMGLDYRDGGRCLYCKTCDGYPCHVDAKCDAEICCLRPALDSGNVELLVNTFARRLLVGSDGLIDSVEVEHDGTTQTLRAGQFVVACGAIPSAALLLRSHCSSHPTGLANSSGLVGANLMFHNCTGMVGIHFTRHNTAEFQKLLTLTDYYFSGPNWPYPLGTIQLLGFYPLQYGGMPGLGRWINSRSIQFFSMSEDLPDPQNRVLCDDSGHIRLRYRPNNLRTHRRLVRLATQHFRRAGYSLVLSQIVPQPQQAGTHVCGTVRFGHDPRTSVLDPFCRTHDVPNLFVVDASFFPSSGAVNPALTIVAQALRVGDHLAQTQCVEESRHAE